MWKQQIRNLQRLPRTLYEAGLFNALNVLVDTKVPLNAPRHPPREAPDIYLTCRT